MLSPKIRGMDEFRAYIDGIARNSRGIATEEITKYLIGNEQRGFKHYPAQTTQKYVRTFNLRNSWVMRGKKTQARAENTAKYSPYVQGTGTQVWWTKQYNWRNIAEIAKTNIKGAIRAAERAIVAKKK
jgi:hypothetical protein